MDKYLISLLISSSYKKNQTTNTQCQRQNKQTKHIQQNIQQNIQKNIDYNQINNFEIDNDTLFMLLGL